MRITTNHHVRPTVDGCELTSAEREQFDYVDWPAVDDGRDSATFFRYRGRLYDLSEFTRLEASPDAPMAGWDGGSADSFFSGVLVRFAERDCESGVVVASYCE